MKQTRRIRSMAVRELEQYIVVVTVRTPTNADWDQYLEIYRSAETRAKRVLVHCSAPPNAAQRVRLRDAEGRTPCLKAVIATTREARIAAIAINWFNPRMRIFGRNEVEAALDYIGAFDADRKLLHRTLDEMHDQLQKELTKPAPKLSPPI
ncbi:hypothetical protein [Pendulispora albinea]|uniref:STAS/SEC14 domain-containing protein n=1 Tax=Pendulispora albinea TaxID=2741071 RepID=A0ABZ2LQJ6_9BACT